MFSIRISQGQYTRILVFKTKFREKTSAVKFTLEQYANKI